VAAIVALPRWEIYSALPNPLAGFEGPLRGGERGEKRKGRQGTEGRGHTPPK